VKHLKTTKWTKNEQTTKIRYFKIPLCLKFEQCEKTKMPLGRKRLRLTQMQNQDDFVQNLINDLCKQTEKIQGQIARTKMGSFVGNDPKYPFV